MMDLLTMMIEEIEDNDIEDAEEDDEEEDMDN